MTFREQFFSKDEVARIKRRNIRKGKKVGKICLSDRIAKNTRK